MPLRTKITLVFVLLFAAFVAGDYLVERRVTYQHFQDLEEQLARSNLERWVYAVEREIAHLAEFAGDWTDWDDAYEFAGTGNPEFIESNLSSEDWFASFNLPVLGFYRADGEIVWERCADAATGELIDLPALHDAIHGGGRPLAVGDERPSASGIIATRHGLLMVASRAIFRTDGSGPAQGFAVFGRFLDHELSESIAKQTLVRGEVTAFDPSDPGALPPALHREIAQSDHETVLRWGGRQLHAYTVVKDVLGRPTVLVRSDTPLNISAQGSYALWVSVLALAGAGLATLALQWGFVQWVVVLPLQKLISHARRVGDTGDLTSKIGRLTNDEIGELAGEFDLMVGRLSASRGELVAQSRATGQAEIASSVAHNLGNVLNSAVVAVDSLKRRMDGLRADGCERAADLLDEHAADLASFLAADPRGAQLSRYLRSLSENLQGDRRGALEDLRRLEEQIKHMEQILGAQREVAQRGTYEEVVLLHEVVAKAIQIAAPSCARHQIHVHADLPHTPALRTDPVQIIQILVNLFTNAKDAMASVEPEQRRLGVRIIPLGGDLAVEVRDSGPGVDPAVADRIFQAGFTTKGEGRGLGLHYCALAARQLGGSLAVRSSLDGPGAVFTLRIPARVAEPEHVAA